MNAQVKFKLLKGFFDEVAATRKLSAKGYQKYTAVGLFKPSNLTKINVGLEVLIAERVIDVTRWFMDPFGGDSRIVDLANGVYGIPSIYVEYDRQLFALAEDDIPILRQLQILDGVPLIMIRGDSTKNRTYRKIYRESSVRFEDIGTIFTYGDNERKIAARVAKRSPPGTVFILAKYLFPPEEEFEGLKLERSLFLDRLVPHMLNNPSYLGVYRK